MKKFVFFAGLLLRCASCTTVKKTSSTQPVSSNIEAAVTADLDVKNTKISYTYYPTSSVRRGGEANVKAAAVAEAACAVTAAGITAAILFGLLAAILFKPKDKS